MMKNSGYLNRHDTGRAVVECQGATSEAAQTIIKLVMTEKLEEKYTNKNIILLLWLYNDKALPEYLLQDRLVDNLHAVTSDDANKKIRPKSRNI
eukprot:12904819-Ditylum_brightwellii.AAC.1